MNLTACATKSSESLHLSLADLRQLYPRRRFPIRRAIIETLSHSTCQMMAPYTLAKRVYSETPSGDFVRRLMQTISLMRKELGTDWLVAVPIATNVTAISLHRKRLIV